MQKSIIEFFEKTVEEHSEKVAIKDTNGQCTFGELKTYAKKIGSGLINYSVENKIIPVFVEKGVLAVELFLGTVYAGAGYSFLNPIQPDKKLEKIINILEAPIIITDSKHYELLSKINCPSKILLAEELLKNQINEVALKVNYNKMVDTMPLYVNFTSGTTGEPKGVVVAHRSVIDFTYYFVNTFKITSEDIIGNQAPFDFDVSVKDIYSMLMTGATLYIIPKEAFSLPIRLMDILVEEKITTLIWAVSALCIITTLKGFEYKIPYSINKVLFSGEVMPIKHLNIWCETLPEAMFVNLYGPTEITCNCTYYVIENKNKITDFVPIGKPFPNEKVFLLDEEGKEVTNVGVEGEICVSGSTLSLGYFKHKEYTDKAFIQNPLNQNYLELTYRTGDIGKYEEDGNLVYVGRKDLQIKHQGHRIELLEIESYLNKIKGIDRASCLYDEERKKIVTFYQGKIEKSVIKKELSKVLARYMIPEKFIKVENIPLNNNGKIDRKELKKIYFGENK